jgi:16S rRNA C967 or C1407 C5-methylase (RsmB/RsmF family)/NOL1/NOP2/fmu family ribosome biogenesis protein
MILLPESFTNRMKMILGPEYPVFRDSLDFAARNSIRINPKKITDTSHLEGVPGCTTGFYLKERPLYTLDPHFHAGAYYVQESSSMFLEQFIPQPARKKVRILDLCAAPGGKSTHLASILSGEGLLVSNEVIHSRAVILSENLKKWGDSNIVVTCNDPKDFSRLPGFFDIIVVDAPCSGEGLFRRDHAAIEEWSESNAVLCSRRQQRILADVWPALAQGGMLVYSTCTFNHAENEENIAWLTEFAQIEPVVLQIPETWGVVETEAAGFPCYRFYPHQVKGEGFFIAAVRKTSETATNISLRRKNGLTLAGKSEKHLLEKLVSQQEISFVKFEKDYLALPSGLMLDLDLLKSSLRIVHAGVKVGEIIREDFNPAHELAVSTILKKAAFPQSEVSLEQAICYLKKTDFSLNFEEKGWNLLTFQGQILGWAKNIGSRFNNNYPKEWRIRMSTDEYKGDKLAAEAAKFPFHYPH